MAGRAGRGVAWLAVCAAAACSPALDWREVRLPGTSVVGMLPCRPGDSTRTVTLADHALQLSMRACKAGEWTWALAAVDAGDPRRVAAVLEACRRSAQENIRGEVRGRDAAAVPGATANALSGQWHLAGRRPDGSEVHARLALFAHGTQVFQATVVGSRPPGAAADPFFEALRVRL